MSLEIDSNFQGGNPQHPHRVRQTGQNAFIVFPEIEINDSPAYKFRMDLTVFNPEDHPLPLTLTVDWAELQYMHLRQRLYVRTSQAKSWHAVDAADRPCETQSFFKIEVPSGMMDLSAQPRYGEQELEELRDFSSACPDLSVLKLGITDQGRPIEAFHFSQDMEGSRPTLLAVARIHPYETAGSYCLDGAVRKLVSNGALRASILKRSDLTLVPIIAPDGVALGYCRLNGSNRDGLDLARQWSDKDRVCSAIGSFARQRQLCAYIEMHNWMHPDRDGVKYTHLLDTFRFVLLMKKLGALNKPWRMFQRFYLLASAYYGAKKWIRDHTSAKCIMVEYPWHARTIEAMAELGLRTIMAFQRIRT